MSTGVPNIKRNEPVPGKELLKQKAIENINAAIDVATDDGVRLTNIGANDIYEGNEKLINGVRSKVPRGGLEISGPISRWFASFSLLRMLTRYLIPL